MTANQPNTHRKAFIKAFNSLSHRHNRHQVFMDFVTLSAISLHNAIAKSDTLEAKYMSTIKRYDKGEMMHFPKFLGLTIEYREQFFTPAHYMNDWTTLLHIKEVISLITKTFESANVPDSQAQTMTENKRIEVGKFEQISLF